MAIVHEVVDAQEAYRDELNRRIDDALVGYPGDTLLPGDLGRLACEVAGVDMSLPRPKPRQKRTRSPKYSSSIDEE